MNKRFISMLFVIALILSCGAAHAWERSSSDVPPDSYLYRDLDKLVAFGLIEPPIVGQRPYMRSEFARMTAEAMKSIEAMKKTDTDSVEGLVTARRRMWQVNISLDRLKKEFHEELVDSGAIEGERQRYHIHALEKAYFYNAYMDSPATTVPRNNGRGTINAQINPLGDYNLGRHPIDGFSSALESVSRFQLGKFLSIYARPRFEVDIPSNNAEMTGHVYLQDGYATFRAGNFSMKVGRDSMVWGAGDRGSLLFSGNARPLDGIWLTNPKPARLPWIFKHLGRWRYTLYTANLGPEQARKWDWIAGYKFSLAPTKYVELGLGHVVMIGGDGAPTPTVVDVIGEFMGFRPAGTSPSAPNLSNHMFEIDYLVRIVPLRGVQLYGNIVIEDKWKSIWKTMTQGMSYKWGVYAPALNTSGSMDLRIEYVLTCPLQYRHSRYADGFTLNRRLIGSDAGPDADTLHTLLRQTISKKLWLGLSLDWDYRRSNSYTELPNRGDIVVTAYGPSEQRYRGMFDLDWTFRKNLTLHFTTGYERILNSNFVDGVDRNNFAIAASLKIDLDKHFGFSAN